MWCQSQVYLESKQAKIAYICILHPKLLIKEQNLPLKSNQYLLENISTGILL